jgi:outer membrane beta-barrel protein
MIRRPALLSALAAAGLLAFPAAALAEEPEMTFEPDDLEDEEPAFTFEEDDLAEEDPGFTFEDDFSDEAELTFDEDDLLGGDDAGATSGRALDQRAEWRDIVVVMRKPFLKMRRLELMPMIGVTTNDNLIRHTQLGGQLNYFLTDVLAVGLEGGIFQRNLREPYDLIARQARRLPTVNQYNYSAGLNFHYTPVYGKFALFSRSIVHWDGSLTAGVGITESEVIPRNPAMQSFTNMLVTPSVGASMRVYFSDFLTLHLGLRDYVFLDRFEALDRTEVSGDAARENGTTALVNHVVLQAGVSFWLPTSFSYSSFR